MLLRKNACLLDSKNNCKRPNKNNKIVLIIGKSGSGKDAFKNELLRINKEECDKTEGCPCKKIVLKSVKQITTRPIRKNEIPGKDYIFLTKKKDIEKFVNDKNIFDLRLYTVLNEDSTSNIWYYGIDVKDINITNDSYLIVGPSTSPIEWVKKYITEFGVKNIVLVYIDSPDTSVFNRLLKREESKEESKRNYSEFCRRYLDNVAEYKYIDDNLEELLSTYQLEFIRVNNNDVSETEFQNRIKTLYQKIINTIVL